VTEEQSTAQNDEMATKKEQQGSSIPPICPVGKHYNQTLENCEPNISEQEAASAAFGQSSRSLDKILDGPSDRTVTSDTLESSHMANPAEEICNNEVDDDHDGLVDWKDEQSCPASVPIGLDGCPDGYHKVPIEPVCEKDTETGDNPILSDDSTSISNLNDKLLESRDSLVKGSNADVVTKIKPPSSGMTGSNEFSSLENAGTLIDCSQKADNYYLNPNDPCIDRLLMLCDDTPDGNPPICYSNPHGYRCLDEAGNPTPIIKECLPPDPIEENCPQPVTEPCYIYGPDRTVLWGAIKKYIGGSGAQGGGENSPRQGILCVEAPEGGCIDDAPFAPGKDCDEFAGDFRDTCEGLKTSGWDEVRKQYLEEQRRKWLDSQYEQWSKQEKERLAKELDDLLKRATADGGPCQGMSESQCNEYLLGLDQCAQGNPTCDEWFEWKEAFDKYLQEHPDVCAGMSKQQCNDYLLGLDQCAQGNPLCPTPKPYIPDISYGEQGPIKTCSMENQAGCWDSPGTDPKFQTTPPYQSTWESIEEWLLKTDPDKVEGFFKDISETAQWGVRCLENPEECLDPPEPVRDIGREIEKKLDNMPRPGSNSLPLPGDWRWPTIPNPPPDAKFDLSPRGLSPLPPPPPPPPPEPMPA
jgi:hypothetical protein